MADDQAHLLDSRGDLFTVRSLSPAMASRFADDLVAAHNLIPYQRWTMEDLLADRDSAREFFGKWEISTIALSVDERPLGFCIGFERAADGTYYESNGIYLHRLAVSSQFQGRSIGALLQAETIARALSRGLKYVQDLPVAPIFGQTNLQESNRRVLLFHHAAGFRQVGEKTYGDRTDAILRLDRPDFEASRHAALWRRRRYSEGGQVRPRPKADVGLQPRASLEQAVLATKEWIASLSSIPASEIEDEDHVKDLLSADSLAILELLARLESALDTEFSEEDLCGVTTVRSLAEMLASKLSGP
ncbi:MAG: GNAT family N-acetyltransferase [Proteobacteria bacterium]|nr:GNAT family N-acetyltransferase [Pseudomonadota bacterium]